MNIQNSKKAIKGTIRKTSKRAKESMKEISKGAKENVEKKYPFNSTSFVNILMYLLFGSFFIIPTTKTMIQASLENIGEDPIWTTLWVCLLSFCTYVFSRYINYLRVNQKRKKSSIQPVNNAQPIIPKEDAINLFLFGLPVILYVYFLVTMGNKVGSNSGFSKFLPDFMPTYLLLIVYSTFFFFFVVIRNKNDEDYVKETKHFAWGSSLIIILGLIFYARSAIYNSPEFTGKFGVIVLDFLLVFIISVRGLCALTYYLFINSPSIRTIWNFLNGFSQPKNVSKNNWINLVALGTIIAFLTIQIFPNNKGYSEFLKIKPKDANHGMIEKRMNLSTYAANWIDKRKGNDDPIFLVAGQGGGSRAGFYTSSILSSLHFASMKNETSFYKNTFALSTVSGSTVGTSFYLNAAKNGWMSSERDSLNTYNALEKFFKTDFVTASVIRILTINPFQKLFPNYAAKNGKNRNEALIELEKDKFFEAWLGKEKSERIKKDDYSSHYSEFPIFWQNSTKSDDYNHPLFFPNTYNVTDAKRSVISSVKIDGCEADYLTGKLLQKDKSITIGQAVNMSQMFPIVSASSNIYNKQYYDGGSYDNSGLATLKEVYSILSKERDRIAPSKKIVILNIENDAGEKEEPNSSKKKNLKEENNKQELLSNSIGVLIKAASGSIFSANVNYFKDDLKAMATSYGDLYSEELGFELNVELNRWLSKTNIDSLKKSAQLNVNSFYIDSIGTRIRTPKSHTTSVYFKSGNHEVDDNQRKMLSSYFKNLKPIQISLIGHTDSDNETKQNKILAQNRISSVQDLLEEIDSTYNFGKDTCILSLDDYSLLEKQLNRKVDIKFLYYDVKKSYYPPFIR